MQITANSTGMLAALAVTADKDARDYCVVVVKGTFVTNQSGTMRLAAEQAPFVYADEHHGDPESSSIRYESDFALFKPSTDVVVVGKAVAPHGQAKEELMVRLEIQGRHKDAVVMGERRWVEAAGGLVASRTLPFPEMPLTFERAFGGEDGSRGPGMAAAETRNLVGVGFHPYRSRKDTHGSPLPNIEDPQQRIKSHRDHPAPLGFGFVGRAWKPRSGFVGTYDQRWLDDVCPFLPSDFDHRYHQGAPPDQQFPHFRGGEVIRCVHMAERPVVQYTIPIVDVPVEFCFRDRDVSVPSVLDTIVLEPHCDRAMLSWRARMVLGKKLDELQEIHVGALPRKDDGARGYRRGKPVFGGIAMTLRWLARRQRPR
jgi:hypothetical protein